jgi:hypothetical protein
MSGRTERKRTGPRVRAIYLVEAGYIVAGAACIEARMMENGADGEAESPESRFGDLAKRDDAFTVIARDQPVLATPGNMPSSKCHHWTHTSIFNFALGGIGCILYKHYNDIDPSM